MRAFFQSCGPIASLRLPKLVPAPVHLIVWSLLTCCCCYCYHLDFKTRGACLAMAMSSLAPRRPLMQHWSWMASTWAAGERQPRWVLVAIVPSDNNNTSGHRYLSIAPAKQRDQRKGGTVLSLVQLPAEGVCINGCGFVSCTGGAEMKQRPSGCTSLFVKNLPYDTSEEAVGAAFRYCIHTHCLVWVQPSRRTLSPPPPQRVWPCHKRTVGTLAPHPKVEGCWLCAVQVRLISSQGNASSQ